MKKHQKRRENIDVQKLNDPEKQKSFKQTLENNFSVSEDRTPQNMWTNITNKCIITAKEVLGTTQKQKMYNNQTLETLSTQQKKLRIQIDSTQDKSQRKKLKTLRNQKMNEIP